MPKLAYAWCSSPGEFAPERYHKAEETATGRLALFHGPQCLAPQGAGLSRRPFPEERHAANGDGRDQYRKRQDRIIGKPLPARRNQEAPEIGTHNRPKPAEADCKA